MTNGAPKIDFTSQRADSESPLCSAAHFIRTVKRLFCGAVMMASSGNAPSFVGTVKRLFPGAVVTGDKPERPSCESVVLLDGDDAIIVDSVE
jgi:hypothetical protein